MIRRRFFAICGAVFGLCLGASGLLAAEGESDRLLYFSPGGPAILRLDVRLAERSLREAWTAEQDQQFERLDTDGNGVLSHEEQKRFPAHPIFQALGMTEATPESRPTSLLLGGSTRSSMSRERFRQHWRQLGIVPLRFAPAPQSSLAYLSRLRPMPARSGEDASESLHARLDANGDGQLEQSELASARQRLRQFDLDRNDALAESELRTKGRGQTVYSLGGSFRSSPQEARPFELMFAKRPWDGLLTKVLAQYDGDDGGTLTPEELPGEWERLGAFDTDQSRTLDIAELRRWFEAERGRVELIARFDGADGWSFDLIEDGTNLDQKGFQLAETNFQIALKSASAKPLDEILREKHQLQDSDQNGYLSLNEVGGQPRQAFFSWLDADGDEQVFAKEYVEALEPLARIQRHQVQITIVQEGPNFFQLVDADRDLRITLPELQTLPGRLKELDRNKDGLFTADESPQFYMLTIREAPLIATGPISAVSQNEYTLAAPRRVATGPDWFQKMDRNGDGYLTTREFLSEPADFQRLDRNDDRLIDAKEAEAVE